MVMEELFDEEGYSQEVTKKEVVSAFLQVQYYFDIHFSSFKIFQVH